MAIFKWYLKAAGEVTVYMMTSLLNHIIVKGVIPAEWELNSILNCHKKKEILYEEETI